jgi:hypothetical protein
MAYAQEAVIKALEDSQGMVNIAAKALGCHPSTIYLKIQKSKILKDKVAEIQKLLIEKPQSVMLDAMDRTDEDGLPDAIAVSAAEKFLKIHPAARKEGFGEKREVEHSGKVDIYTKMYEDDDEG